MVVVGNPAVSRATSSPVVATGVVGEAVQERCLGPVRAEQVPAQAVDEQDAADLDRRQRRATLRSPGSPSAASTLGRTSDSAADAVPGDDQVSGQAGGRRAHGASRAVAVETAAPNRWVRVTRSLPSAAALTRSTKSSAVTVPV